MASLVRDKYIEESKKDSNVVIQNHELDKYELMAIQIDEGSSSEGIEGFLDLLDITTDSMSSLPNVTNNIINSVTFITNKFTEKTKLINSVITIKDDKLRIKKGTQIINAMALDLDKYSNELSSLIPKFADTLNIAIESYTKLLLMASESSVFLNEAEEQLKKVFPELYNSLDSALIGISEFLNSLTGLPVMTSKFGNSKRRAELTTNTLFKEFINSKKIMQQLLNS